MAKQVRDLSPRERVKTNKIATYAIYAFTFFGAVAISHIMFSSIERKFYPPQIAQYYLELKNAEQNLNQLPISMQEEYKRAIEQGKEWLDTYYPDTPLWTKRWATNEKTRKLLLTAFTISGLASVAGVVYLFLRFYKKAHQKPLQESAFKLGKPFNPFQPERWGSSLEEIISLFKDKESFEKYMAMQDGSVEKKIVVDDITKPDGTREIIERYYKPEEINDILEIIHKRYDEMNLAFEFFDKDDLPPEKLKAILGLWLFHRYSSFFGGVKIGVLNTFLKEDYVKEFFSYLLPSGPDTLRVQVPPDLKASKLISLLKLTNFNIYSLPLKYSAPKDYPTPIVNLITLSLFEFCPNRDIYSKFFA